MLKVVTASLWMKHRGRNMFLWTSIFVWNSLSQNMQTLFLMLWWLTFGFEYWITLAYMCGSEHFNCGHGNTLGHKFPCLDQYLLLQWHLTKVIDMLYFLSGIVICSYFNMHFLPNIALWQEFVDFDHLYYLECVWSNLVI